jgi:hypothetical protein
VLILQRVFYFQVDANAFSVEFSNVSFNINYAQSVADIRAVARVVARSVPSAQLIWRLYQSNRLLVVEPFPFHIVLCQYCTTINIHYISKFQKKTCVFERDVCSDSELRHVAGVQARVGYRLGPRRSPAELLLGNKHT